MPQSPMFLPTTLAKSIPMESSSSASHREFENNYTEMPQSPTSIPMTLSTSIPTDRIPSASHRKFENNYTEMPQSPTSRRTDVRRHLTESSKIITPKCHNHRRPYRRHYRRQYPSPSLVANFTDKNTDGMCKFQRV